VSKRSAKRLPASLWVPKLRRRQTTARGRATSHVQASGRRQRRSQPHLFQPNIQTTPLGRLLAAAPASPPRCRLIAARALRCDCRATGRAPIWIARSSYCKSASSPVEFGVWPVTHLPARPGGVEHGATEWGLVQWHWLGSTAMRHLRGHTTASGQKEEARAWFYGNVRAPHVHRDCL